MTNVDALKNLYVAFGGAASDVVNLSTSADVINALATHVASGGAAELPAVKAADNGKVLTVVSGAWAAANLPAANNSNT